jgi:hypothetical protein
VLEHAVVYEVLVDGGEFVFELCLEAGNDLCVALHVGAPSCRCCGAIVLYDNALDIFAPNNGDGLRLMLNRVCIRCLHSGLPMAIDTVVFDSHTQSI